MTNYINFAFMEIYSSLWSDSPSSWSTVGEEGVNGISRKEEFMKIDLYHPELVPPSSPNYNIPADTQAQWKLNELKPLENFDVKVNDGQIFKYGVDYELGDIVTVRNIDWGIEADLEIVSVTIESNGNEMGYNVFLTFGNKIPKI